MRRAIANFLLSLATSLGAKRVQVNVVKDSYSASTADVVWTKADWGEENASALARFMGTPAGVALTRRLRVVAAEVAINGAMDRANTVHAAGVSAGWNEAVRYLISLSRVSRVEDTNNAGQAPQDEARLLELLSP